MFKALNIKRVTNFSLILLLILGLTMVASISVCAQTADASNSNNPPINFDTDISQDQPEPAQEVEVVAEEEIEVGTDRSSYIDPNPLRETAYDSMARFRFEIFVPLIITTHTSPNEGSELGEVDKESLDPTPGIGLLFDYYIFGIRDFVTEEEVPYVDILFYAGMGIIYDQRTYSRHDYSNYYSMENEYEIRTTRLKADYIDLPFYFLTEYNFGQLWEPMSLYTVAISIGPNFIFNLTSNVDVVRTYHDLSTFEVIKQGPYIYHTPKTVNVFQFAGWVGIHNSFDMFGYGEITFDILMSFGFTRSNAYVETAEFFLYKGHQNTYMFSLGYRYRLDRLVEHMVQLFELMGV